MYLFSKIMSYKICFLVTTYQRPKACKELVDSLLPMGDVYVLNDGSTKRYPPLGATKYKKQANQGKQGYWKTTTNIWQMVRDGGKEYDYYLFIQDDMSITPKNLDRAIRLYERIDDPHLICLNLFVGASRYRKITWTGVLPVDYGIAMKTQWTDMNCFLTKKDFYKFFDWTIPNTMRRTVKSSGVGRYISKTINNAYRTIYQPYASLAIPTEEAMKSLMNPWRDDLDENTEFHTVIPGTVIVQIASIPEREKKLKKTIESLLPQVDRMRIMLNGYDHTPEFLKDIEHVHLDNSTGDAAKFYGVEYLQGYIFTCDDDLIYPPDYIERTIDKINTYKCPVSWHGRIYTRPYRGYKAVQKYIRYSWGCATDTEVDIGGTGVMGFHSSHINIRYSDFREPNMADVWMAVLCRQQGSKIMCLAHRGEIKGDKGGYTIYDERNAQGHKRENEILSDLFLKKRKKHKKNQKGICVIKGKKYQCKIKSVRPDDYYLVDYKTPGGWRKKVLPRERIYL